MFRAWPASRGICARRACQQDNDQRFRTVHKVIIPMSNVGMSNERHRSLDIPTFDIAIYLACALSAASSASLRRVMTPIWLER
jgi:hypothetical protein